MSSTPISRICEILKIWHLLISRLFTSSQKISTSSANCVQTSPLLWRRLHAGSLVFFGSTRSPRSRLSAVSLFSHQSLDGQHQIHGAGIHLTIFPAWILDLSPVCRQGTMIILNVNVRSRERSVFLDVLDGIGCDILQELARVIRESTTRDDGHLRSQSPLLFKLLQLLLLRLNVWERQNNHRVNREVKAKWLDFYCTAELLEANCFCDTSGVSRVTQPGNETNETRWRKSSYAKEVRFHLIICIFLLRIFDFLNIALTVLS